LKLAVSRSRPSVPYGANLFCPELDGLLFRRNGRCLNLRERCHWEFLFARFGNLPSIVGNK